MRIGVVDECAVLGDSWLHRALPSAKLVAFALMLAAVVVSWNLLVILSLALLLTAVARSARLPMRDVTALAAYPGLFAVVFALAAAPDVFGGALLVARAITAALGAIVLVFTTPYPQVFAPIQAVTPSLVGDALLMTYRSLFLLLEKFGDLLRAVRLRAGLHVGSPARAARATTQALGGLLMYSFDLAQREYDVMRLRGYERALRAESPASSSPMRDAAIIAAAAGAAMLSVTFRVAWRELNPYSWIPLAASLTALMVVTLVTRATPARRPAISRPTGGK